MLRRLLLLAAENKRLEDWVGRNRLTRRLVSRYVAGTTLDEAIAAALTLNSKGIDVSLDLLGETVSDLRESAAATDAYVDAVRAIADRAPGATVSVKLSQLGIALDQRTCAGHLQRLLEASDRFG